ncbi:DUF3892 domain-containing protein [Pseudomonas mosselii]|uniref:DUF3892 domain-containing protein n=1 Tax=Pseudomonas mosselii TaxID=78327 RepID=UPI001E5E3CCC|nr:DUF3892 domain-containing protein [Pseudomonas mosselii]MCL8300881.1 DUF3892 domain-containing protein [Pseudomonas mosselii]MCL8341223.1 DUF3892 domain-containing protein [Pseudomonas mosselii]WJR28448.1 DUF3892 domain-containing protein [Pseudomonas mosselii]
MSKIDYYVSAVEYNSDDSHIAKLEVWPFGDAKQLKTSKIMSRPEVIELIKKNKTFATMTKNRNGQWQHGSILEVIPVTTDYLKTKKDSSTRDNLENLPKI